MTDTQIYEASLSLSTKDAKILSLDFEWPEEDQTPPSLSFYESGSSDIWIFLVHTVGKPNLDNISFGLKLAGQIIGRNLLLSNFLAIEEKDWVSESQKLNAPVFAGRYIAYGSHDSDKIDKSKTTLLIEAGQAFGTGAHPTTKGCLLALDELANNLSPKNALDLGCGSGVLAIAMAKTWNIPVLATDIDPIATQTTLENMVVNNSTLRALGEKTKGIYAQTAASLDHSVFENEGPFELIMANILAEPLCDMASDIFRNTKEGGILIISGLLATQKGLMIEAFEDVGYRYMKGWPIDEWISLAFKK